MMALPLVALSLPVLAQNGGVPPSAADLHVPPPPPMGGQEMGAPMGGMAPMGQMSGTHMPMPPRPPMGDMSGTRMPLMMGQMPGAMPSGTMPGGQAPMMPQGPQGMNGGQMPPQGMVNPPPPPHMPGAMGDKPKPQGQ